MHARELLAVMTMADTTISQRVVSAARSGLQGAARLASHVASRLGAFRHDTRANIAMIFGLSLIPLAVATGTGVDLGRALVVRARLTQALDAAGLAVGATQGLSVSQMQTLAQQYFTANYKADDSFGVPSPVTVSVDGQSVTLASDVDMPTTLMRIAGFDKMTVGSESKVVWGQTKLWVSLVLDNTGSMAETDHTGTSKMDALKDATHQLLAILKNAATNDGDVRVAIVPFSKDVNVDKSNKDESWLDWTDWLAAPSGSMPSADVGPGSDCPWSNGWGGQGYSCQKTPSNGSSTTSTVPSSGSYKGYICPTADNGRNNSGLTGHYYNGCYNSVYTGQSCHTSYGHTTCTNQYSHTWIPNDKSTWKGCVMDRNQNYDVTNTTASAGNTDTLFPAENSQYCLSSTLTPLTYDWDTLSDQVDAMSANGNTNQGIGIAWGWQAITDGDPMNAGTLPKDTSRVIILLSDGVNTQNRWTNSASSIDARESQTCSNAKDNGVIIYTVFVDLDGTSGSSSVLEGCATDASKYFDLTTSGQIIDTFNQIAQQITDLRVAK